MYNSTNGYKVPYDDIGYCDKLEHVIVDSPSEFTCISNLPKLKYLRIRNSSSAQKLKKFFEVLDGSELIKLDLSFSNISKIVLTAIIKRGGFPNLKYLFIDGCTMIGREVELMKQFIRCCPKLRVLSLKSVFKVFKSETMQALEEQLVENKLKIVFNFGSCVRYSQREKLSYKEIIQKYHVDFDDRELNETKLGSDCQHW